MFLRSAAALLLVLSYPCGAESKADDTAGQGPFWAARDIEIPKSPGAPPVRIGIWDSGVDLSLFTGRLALDTEKRPLVRGYDPFKRRQDTPMAVLPSNMAERQEELNRAIMAFDDIDGRIDSPAARAMNAKLAGMSKEEQASFDDAVGRWSGYVHGTAVADIAMSGHDNAEIVVARMEWWHGSPPVPCWNRELADREAASIRDLLTFLVASGAKVVNMSWGRFESSYLGNLAKCAPAMAIEERTALARYTVQTIRSELRAGMAAAPNVLFVGAAGNEGKALATANPATRFSLPNFLLVGAVDRSGAFTDYTNIGLEISIYANGDRVPARLPGGLRSFPTGTSMATPNVANAAAKMLAVNPRLTGAELRSLIEQTADTNATGQRLLHTARAVEAARARTLAPAN
jgi:hypothetical protein